MKDTLVIGAGIAGIQASLEIANSGHKVYLVEKSPTIGGHMAMFDKTFPTLDCAACILTPKMVEVGQHPKIDLNTYSEVQYIEKKDEGYLVKIKNRSRKIDMSRCIGCGICAEKCPVKVKSEFDADTTFRKAAYIPFPQAVPNKYVIDENNCRFILEGKCGVCQKLCPAECIDFEEKDMIRELMVGNIILATGYQLFDARKLNQYGYGEYPNVLTALELERLVNAAGPTEGEIRFRTRDKKGNWMFTKEAEAPERIALIHCVGSRDQNHNSHCSRVCCMYSLKLAHLIREKLPESDIYEFYIDMRAFGKGYEEFYNRIKEEGINIIRGKTAKVRQENGHLKLRGEHIEADQLIDLNVDMVVLASGLEARPDTKFFSDLLDIEVGGDGFFKGIDPQNDGEVTTHKGVFIAGCCQGPKDIPDSVAQGSAAAAKVIQRILKSQALEKEMVQMN